MKCESMGNGFFFPGDVHGGYLGMHVRSRRSVCVCAYRASPSLATNNIINLISVLIIWRCPCVESSLVFLEEGVCYDQCVLLAKLY